MHESDSKFLRNLIIEKKCDETLIGKLDQFCMEAQMKKEDYDSDVFSDQELLCRVFSLLDDEQIDRNFGFLKYVARKFQVDSDLFFDFVGRELK